MSYLNHFFPNIISNIITNYYSLLFNFQYLDDCVTQQKSQSCSIEAAGENPLVSKLFKRTHFH